jgi:cytoskeletal protein CcmA (bactofilin family)
MAWFKKINGGAEPLGARQPQNSAKNQTTYLGQNLTVSGSIYGGDAVQIFGRHDGDVYLDGDLSIGSTAVIRGHLRAATIRIGGRAEGDITAAAKLTIDSTGVVTGNIATPALAMAEGAMVNGDIKMRP